MTEKFQTVIIGGGVGGTAVGALLASAGQKVLLLEKNNIIGGRCMSYEKDGFLVDLGVHLFANCEKGSLGEVCRRAGEPDAIDWIIARRPKVSMFMRGQIRPFSSDFLMQNMSMISPDELAGAAGLFVNMMQMPDEELYSLWYVPIQEWMYRYTKSKEVLGFLAMICSVYFCTPPETTSTTEFIKSFRDITWIKNSGYPRGGCVAIPKAYQKIIEKNGGQVRLGSPVEKIVIENNKVKGVMADGKLIEADRVISNADIKATIEKLAGSEHFPSDYVKRIRQLTYSAYCVSLKVAVDKKLSNERMLLYTPNVGDEELMKIMDAFLQGKEIDMVPGGMMNSITNFDPALAPEGQQMIYFGTSCKKEQDWTLWGRLMMNALKEMMPEIEDHVLWTRIDTPGTVEHYAGEDGNVIGIGQTVDQIHERRPKHETPVEGLYLCSAEAGGHGIGTELAASSALELADRLLGVKK